MDLSIEFSISGFVQTVNVESSI